MLTSGTSRLALLTVIGAVTVAAWLAPTASAATQRYASPTGSGTACSAASPCSITEAVKPTYTDDEVIVAPGDYALTELGATGITVHGIPGKPRPRLLLANGPTPAVMLYHATLRYLEVDRAPGEQGITVQADDSSLDQVIVRGTAQSGWRTAAIGGSTTIRNSIIVAPGSSGTAIWTEPNGSSAAGTFRNVTAIATQSGGVAIRVRATGAAGYASVLVRNVIARGGSGGASLVAETDNSGATAKITIGNSNWLGKTISGTKASIVDGGWNQSAAPVFVSAAGGDYHEAPGSPTIDAGLSEFIDGPVDIDGDPRQIGSIDIGADEFVTAPAATTGPATEVTDHSTTLNGGINANGAPTSYHFEYGPTTAYGSITPTTDSGAGDAVVAAAALSGLSSASTYHYRLVATNSGGTSEGADQTFTTAAPPETTLTPVSIAAATEPSPAQTATTQASAFTGVKLVSTRLSFSGRSISIKLSCPSGTVGRCSGRTKLTARQRPGSAAASLVTVGGAPFSIAAGTQTKVTVRVSRAGRRVLSRVRRLAAKDANAARDGLGQAKTTVATVTIRSR